MNRTIGTTEPEPDRSATPLRRLRRSIAVFAGLLMGAVALAAAAPSAFAMNVVPPPGGPEAGSTTPAAVVHSGMLGWQITLIAVGAAVLSAAVTAVLVRMGPRSRLGHAAG
jgi:hypothetical protein